MSGGRFVFRFGQGGQGSQPQLPRSGLPDHRSRRDLHDRNRPQSGLGGKHPDRNGRMVLDRGRNAEGLDPARRRGSGPDRHRRRRTGRVRRQPRLRGDHDHGRTEQGHRHDHARHARTRLHAPHLSAGRVRRLHLQPRRHRKRAYLPLRHRPGRKHRPDVARRPHRIFDAGTRGGQLRMGARQTAGVA